jgi:hypothetical protein
VNVCTYLGDDGIKIIDAKWICEVIAMIPFISSSDIQIRKGSQYYVLEDMSLGRTERGTSINQLNDVNEVEDD